MNSNYNYNKSILILEKFFDNFIRDFQGILDIKFTFEPLKIFQPQNDIYGLSFMVHYKYFIDNTNKNELTHAAIYQWVYMDIFSNGSHYLCNKNGETVTHSYIKNYIKEGIPQAFKDNFFTVPIDLDYLELKNLASKIKEYDSLSSSLPINEGKEKEITKI